jgi:hypothetical protein
VTAAYYNEISGSHDGEYDEGLLEQCSATGVQKKAFTYAADFYTKFYIRTL